MNLLLLICDVGGFFINTAAYGQIFERAIKLKVIQARDETWSEIY
ncbi:hypothetical protein FORC066_2535 [Yersinia enterocolitica]|nr:hypothetical protein FORC066_2535 [Yersinia enterocolitica]